MKTTIAFRAFIAAICTVAHTTAQQASHVRGSAQESEEDKRKTLSDGWEMLRNTGVQISQCVGMTPTDCLALAQGLADAHPEWFPQENVPVLVANERELHQKIPYYHVGIPTSNGKVANNCMVQYRYDWCLDLDGATQCVKIGPWDCSNDNESGCLSTDLCCGHLQASYPGVDINGNGLQCYDYDQPTPPEHIVPAHLGSSLTMHFVGNQVAIPAILYLSELGNTNPYVKADVEVE